MPPLDPGAYDVLTLDCHGTLIDRDTGVAAALRTALGAPIAGLPDEELLGTFDEAEGHARQAGRPYREVLGASLEATGSRLGARPDAAARATFCASVADWPAFADTADALARLQGLHRLIVLADCDDEDLALVTRRLGIDFDDAVTAEQAGAYRPDEAPFELAFERACVPRERILHVACGADRDLLPAARLGLQGVRIARRPLRPGQDAAAPPGPSPAPQLADLAALADRLIG